jgi:hypothetical protein
MPGVRAFLRTCTYLFLQLFILCIYLFFVLCFVCFFGMFDGLFCGLSHGEAGAHGWGLAVLCLLLFLGGIWGNGDGEVWGFGVLGMFGDVWEFCLGILFGNFVWEFCLGLYEGWPSWGTVSPLL